MELFCFMSAQSAQSLDRVLLASVLVKRIGVKTDKSCTKHIGGLVAKSCPTLMTPWTVAHQAPLSTGFSRQEYWHGLPFPSPGIFPTQWLNLGLLHCRQILYQLSYQGIPLHIFNRKNNVEHATH